MKLLGKIPGKLPGRLPGRGARAWLSGAALALTLAAAQTTAHAEAAQIDCAFLEIEASNTGEGIDKELQPLTKKLTRPPLSAWKRFKLVAKQDKKLAHMKEQELGLKAGGKLAALYREHSKPEGKKNRFSLSLTLDDKAGKRTLDTKIVVDAGDYFVIALSPSRDKSDLLAVTCKAP